MAKDQWMDLRAMRFIERMAKQYGLDPREVIENYISSDPTLSRRERAERLAAERGGSVDDWERHLADLAAEFRAHGEAEGISDSRSPRGH